MYKVYKNEDNEYCILRGSEIHVRELDGTWEKEFTPSHYHLQFQSAVAFNWIECIYRSKSFAKTKNFVEMETLFDV